MEPRIERIAAKKLIGKRIRTTLAENRAPELWRSFMQRRKEIRNSVSSDLISMQVYDEGFDMRGFTPQMLFDRWAAVEVRDLSRVPDEMEAYILPAGLYAVFLHRGGPSAGPKTYQYIFQTWLPSSQYLLDSRPHFEILGEKYKGDHPESEEEIWIPIKQRS